MKKKIVVFAPHPDDETLGCGGTIIKRIHEGYEVILVVITDGRLALSANDGIESDPSPEEVKIMRREELHKVAKVLGIAPGNLICLDFEDLTVEINEPQIEKCVKEILCKLKTEEISEIYFPWEHDHHKDHQITSEIVQRSIAELRISASAYKYSLPPRFLEVHSIAVDISPFLNRKTQALKQYKSQTQIISRKQRKPVLQKIKRYLKKHETFIVG
jgi:LmbE family N-acetylglucosaminyl deacetylase